MSDPWATLTPFGDGDNDDSDKASSIIICKDEFTVGRSKTCDHLLQGKKMISGRHFVVRKIDGGGGASGGRRANGGDGGAVGGGGASGVSGGSVMAELEDCSTNGTMLNRASLVKRAKVPLRDGE